MNQLKEAAASGDPSSPHGGPFMSGPASDLLSVKHVVELSKASHLIKQWKRLAEQVSKGLLWPSW